MKIKDFIEVVDPCYVKLSEANWNGLEYFGVSPLYTNDDSEDNEFFTLDDLRPYLEYTIIHLSVKIKGYDYYYDILIKR